MDAEEDHVKIPDDETTEAIEEAIEDGRVEMASDDQVEAYVDVIDEILRLIDHEEALVTDMSTLNDFRLGEPDIPEYDKWIQEHFEVVARWDDPIYEIAKRIHNARKITIQ